MKLKRHLGLLAFPHVEYARLIGVGGLRVYFIFFDSRVPAAIITSYEAFKKEFATAVVFNNDKRLSMTNLLPIEDWSGTENGCLFVRVDLSGRFANYQNYTVQENTTRIIVEDMTLTDFKSADAIDAMTQKFRTQRRKMLGKETMRVKLVNVRWNTKQDWTEFIFKSVSTPNTITKNKTQPKSNFAVVPNPPKIYTLTIRLCSFFTWMLKTLPEGQQLTMKDMRDAVRVCPVKVFSDSPAFHWQGLNYNMSILGASLHPTDIAPMHWNEPQYHGDNGMLDKHLGALIRNIGFFTNHMTAMLNSRLTKAGIIKNVKYNFQK